MKKLTKAWLTILLTLSAVFSAAGCGGDKGCKHNVGSWYTITNATCVEKGLKEGTCGICYELVREDIPVDPNAHVWGEWSIQKPTEATEGEANRTCTANGKHEETLVLPVLGADKYDSELIKAPTPEENGLRHYVLKADTSVEFDSEVNRSSLDTVRDAVELSVEKSDMIRSATGEAGWSFYNASNAIVQAPLVTKHYYEHGDDAYTYIKETDSENKVFNRWYFKDDEGNVYGLTDWEGGGKIVNDIDSSSDVKYLNGSRLYIQYYGGSTGEFGYYYGTEELLNGLYNKALESTNGDFKEWTATDENNPDKKTYGFSYGSVKKSGKTSEYFTCTTVSFTLTSLFTIESLDVESIIYVNSKVFTRDEMGEDVLVPSESIITWEENEDGIAYLVEGGEEGQRYVSTISLSQTLKTASDDVPVNPHSEDELYVTSFDITYNGEVLGEDDVATFASGRATDRIFGIANIQPVAAIQKYGFDGFSFYLRKEVTKLDGSTEIVDEPISFQTSSTMTVSPLDSAQKFFLNSKLAGEQTVVIKTKNTERILKCNVREEPPSALYPSVYEYLGGNSSETYVWNTSDTQSYAITVYEGQPLYFNAAVPEEEKSYASAGYISSVSPILVERDENGDPILDDDGKIQQISPFSAAYMGGQEVTCFEANYEGQYTITLTWDADSNENTPTVSGAKTCKIVVTVLPKPTFASLTEKTYSQQVTFRDSFYLATVEFGTVEETTTANDKGEQVPAYKVEATVTLSGATEKITCIYNIQDKTMASEYAGGYKFGFKLAFNEAYDFVLSRYIEEYEVTESVVLVANS